MTTDMAYGKATLLTTQSMDIVPSSSLEHWIIHNIIIPFGASCEIYQTDGTNEILWVTTSTSLLSYNLHCNTDYYYYVKNVGATTIKVSYNGVIV
jgi:hypothetical protein